MLCSRALQSPGRLGILMGPHKLISGTPMMQACKCGFMTEGGDHCLSQVKKLVLKPELFR